MRCKSTEFQTEQEMMSFYESVNNSFFLELNPESPKKFYGLEFIDYNYSIFFASDNLSSLQTKDLGKITVLLIDTFFIIIKDTMEIKVYKLNAPGDTILYFDNIVIVVYELGILFFNPVNFKLIDKPSKDLIIDWEIKDNSELYYRIADNSWKEIKKEEIMTIL